MARIHHLPTSIAEAESIQDELRKHIDLASGLAKKPTLVAGVDVSYDRDSRRAAAAAVLMRLPLLELQESAVAYGEVTFPYVPGLLAFREVLILLEALGKLAGRPDVLVCDGYGIAHPRKFGLACHIGVLTGLPTLGVAKTPFIAKGGEPGKSRGEWSPLLDGGAVVGRVLRTQSNIRPVFISVGHRISLDEATELVLETSPRYRLPEPIRRADYLSRQFLRLTSESRGGGVGADPG